MSDAHTPKAIDTQLIHAGEDVPARQGAVITPIYQCTVFEIEPHGYDDLGYIRYNNLPNHYVLAGKLAALAGAEDAVVAASGMAAISAAMLTFTCGENGRAPGGHLLHGGALYGGTHGLLTRRYAAFGLSHSGIDLERPDTWEAALRPETRVVYVETLSNPLLEVAPLGALVDFARKHSLITIVDNTFASPVNARPIEHGFDLVVESATKYLNGHSDLVAGAVMGSRDHLGPIHETLKLLGGTLDPHACFLLQRGLKTLGVRVRRANETALRVAAFLEAHPKVARVHHPGLASHPHHERAARLLDGFGGMLAFELADADLEATDRVLGGTQLFVHAPSLGGVESLIVSPARSSHALMSAEARHALGITDGLIRVSVGLEDPDELLADLDRALALA
ncbi:MAG: PLP-dependent aspartate aminotransferase family protein [Acidobacteriota bacterium]